MPKKEKKPETTLEKAAEYWYSVCRQRDLSEATVHWYQQRLEHFQKWLTLEVEHPPVLSDFTTASFSRFILEKQTSGVYLNHPNHEPQERKPSSAYIHGYFRTVRAFGAFLEKYELLVANPMKKLEMPRLQEKQLQPLTVTEERTVLEHYDETTPTGCRIKAIVMLMLDAGLRRAEVVGLKFEDVNLREGNLKVLGKGRKERYIPFGHKTAAVMQRYAMMYREPATPSVQTFFVDRHGNAMTTNALKLMIDRVAKKSGVTRLHPHLFRHTFGIRSEEIGMPSLTLQKVMGHSDVRVTQRYAHAADSEKIRADRSYSHLDQLPVKVKKAPKGKVSQ